MVTAFGVSLGINALLVIVLYCLWCEWPKKPRVTCDPFKEFLDIPAEDLADLYTDSQLYKAYEHAAGGEIRSHLNAAVRVHRIRADLKDEETT